MTRIINLVELEKKGRHVQWIGKQEVVLVKTAGGVRSFSGMCPHQGGPLGESEMEGDNITCAWHGCTFEVEQGHCLSVGTCIGVSGMKLKLLRHEIRGDQVYVDV